MKIEVKNISKSFKKINILSNININLEEGHIYGLIGRNGSGKSVFLKLLCSFYEPDEGDILYDGESIVKSDTYPPSTRALIEHPNFLPNLSGKENLMLLASIQNKIGESEIDEILEELDLTEDKDKKYHTYSLGMKQKIGLAQVFMENPNVIILDEPFNGLDSKSVQKLRKKLLSLKKQNKIIIISTHLKEDVEKLCDIIYQVDNKEINLMKDHKNLEKI